MEILEGPDPRTLPEPRLFWRRRLWHRRRVTPLLRPSGERAQPARSRDHRRARQGAVELFAHRGRRGGARARAGRSPPDARAGRDRRCASRGGRSRGDQVRAGAQAEQRPLLHRLGAAAARDADRRNGRADRGLDDARPPDAARRDRIHSGEHARRRAGRARRARPQRRRARDDRRQGLCLVDLQPRDAGDAPARIGVQAVRLSGGSGERLHARGQRRRPADQHRRLEPAQRLRALFGRDQPSHRLRLFDQHDRREDRRRRGHLDDRRHGAPLRHHHADQHPPVDGARHLRRPPHRHDARLRIRRQQGRRRDAIRHHQGDDGGWRAALRA